MNRTGYVPEYKNTFHAFYKIARLEGILGLYRGVHATAIRASMLTASQLSSYDETKYQLKKFNIMSEGISLHFVGSVLAGLITSLSIYPLFTVFLNNFLPFLIATVCAPSDIIKTRLLNQSKSIQSHTSQYKGFIDCLSKIIKHEGPAALMRGWLPSYLRLAPHFIVAIPLYEQLRKLTGLGAF